MAQTQTIEVTVKGMGCTECTQQVHMPRPIYQTSSTLNSSLPLAAAAQSLPDIGILANSSRLLKQ